ncbi:MAG: SDR family oxidoreductase [Rubrivivax sp.]
MSVALVTGAGGSIGAEVAVKLAAAGHTIAVNDIEGTAAAATVDRIRRSGGQASPFIADVGDPDEVDRLLEKIESSLGSVGILVNNAGVPGRFSLIVDMSNAGWATTRRVHMDGPFYLTRGTARQMIPRRFGRIVSIASIAALEGTVGSAEYAAAKAGLVALTKTAAKELGSFGITANVVLPGMVATPINQALQDKNSAFISAAVAGTPTGRMVNPVDVASAVAYLVSDAGAGCNGASLVLDGGTSTMGPMDPFMHGFLAERSPFLSESNGAKESSQ